VVVEGLGYTRIRKIVLHSGPWAARTSDRQKHRARAKNPAMLSTREIDGLESPMDALQWEPTRSWPKEQKTGVEIRESDSDEAQIADNPEAFACR
jgi:hypothetical protein